MTNNSQVTTDELYHVFVPYQIAKHGGTQKFTSRTGKIYEVNIPANCIEGSQIRLDKTSSGFLNKISDLFSQKTVFNQKYSVITLHTLFEQNDNIDKMIFNLATAISASMAYLGGIGLITGGTATVAFIAGFAAWKFLKGDKNDPKKILKQLEAKLYS